MCSRKTLARKINENKPLNGGREDAGCTWPVLLAGYCCLGLSLILLNQNVIALNFPIPLGVRTVLRFLFSGPVKEYK